MKKQGSLKNREIAAALDVPVDTLASWVKGGFVIPGVRAAKGRGDSNLFGLEDAYRAALFARLVVLGIARDEAAKAANISGWDSFTDEQPAWAMLTRKIVPPRMATINLSVHRQHDRPHAPADVDLALWLDLASIRSEVFGKIESAKKTPAAANTKKRDKVKIERSTVASRNAARVAAIRKALTLPKL